MDKNSRPNDSCLFILNFRHPVYLVQQLLNNLQLLFTSTRVKVRIDTKVKMSTASIVSKTTSTEI